MSLYPVPCISAEASGQLTYDMGRGSQCRVTECGTNGKYNNEPSKTGVPKDAPVGSWRAGMQHLPWKRTKFTSKIGRNQKQEREGRRRWVGRISDSPVLLSEGLRACKGMFSGLLTRLSLLVLMLILMTLPEPTDSGFASIGEIRLSTPTTLWQVPLDLIRRIKRNTI